MPPHFAGPARGQQPAQGERDEEDPVCEGIDEVGGRLEYEFHVQAGVDLGMVRGRLPIL